MLSNGVHRAVGVGGRETETERHKERRERCVGGEGGEKVLLRYNPAAFGVSGSSIHS